MIAPTDLGVMLAPLGDLPPRGALGDAMDATANNDTGGDALLNQLHLLAQAIVQDRNYISAQINNISNADADVDWDGMTAAAQAILQLKGQFAAVAAQRAQQTAGMTGVSGFEQAILDVGDWAQGVLNALPNALAAIPNALIDALGKIANNAGNQVLGASMPWLLAGAAVIGLVLFAEKSRTFRRHT